MMVVLLIITGFVPPVPYTIAVLGVVGPVLSLIGVTAGVRGLRARRTDGRGSPAPWLGLLTPLPWLALLAWYAFAFFLLSNQRGPIFPM
jgi:hypothetical protein